MLETIAWKAALVMIAAHLAAWVLSRRSAAEKHLLWVVAVAALLALPLMERSTPAVVVFDAPSFASSAPSQPGPASSVAITPQPDWIPRIWWTGFFAIVAYQLAGMLLLRLRDRRLHGSPLVDELRNQMGITRTVRLYISNKARTPMTWGVIRPSILLPAEALQWTEERMRVVLCHELAHVVRFDFLTQFAASIAAAVYWYNPLVWLAAAAMRREREKACDDVVLRHGARASDYAEHLLALASTGITPATALPMAEASHIESRIRAALNPGLRRSAPSSRGRMTAAALAAVTLFTVLVVKTNAQAGTGRVGGSVLDSSGAVIPFTEVRAVARDGSRRDITRSGPDGRYIFEGLPEGTYTIEARQAGFAVLAKGGIAVKANEAALLDLTLEMGKIMDTVEVVGRGTPARAFTTSQPAGPPQRIRVGGNVQAAKLIRQPKPEYPQYLQAQGVEGTVLLEGIVSTSGSLISLRNLNNLVHADLVKAATDAVRQWEYQPTLLNGRPVEIITTITVTYRLTP